MSKLITALIATLFLMGVQTQAVAMSAQNMKMKTCNADAKTKALKGDERKAFMKGCLSAKGDAAPAAAAAAAPASSACEDKAIDKNGKKLAGAAKTASIKKCEGDANAAK